MVDFNLTEEQRMYREMARKFAEKVIRPRAFEMDEKAEFPYDIAQKMGELGFMGIPFPEKYGGVGGNWVSMMLCIEEISWGDISLGTLLDVTTTVVGNLLYTFGTEEQKQRWLIPMAQGKEIGVFGLTEPDSGSDAAASITRAYLDGDEWVINGRKQFITNVGLKNASVMITTVKIRNPETEKDVINSIIIPVDTPGFIIEPKYSKLGWRASDTHPVAIEDCRVPKENLLGEPGRGFAHHLQVLAIGRISVAAMSVGLAQACLDESLSYAKIRVQFGQPICKFQGVSFKLADMVTEIELARLMYLKAAWLADQGEDFRKECYMAKLFASEAANRAANSAVQIHGGYGFTNEYPVSRWWREVKINEIGEGTSEVQRMLIARLLGC
jgi:alkylation response protein AidB-like acyl-CoA dehydrogenase